MYFASSGCCAREPQVLWPRPQIGPPQPPWSGQNAGPLGAKRAKILLAQRSVSFVLQPTFCCNSGAPLLLNKSSKLSVDHYFNSLYNPLHCSPTIERATLLPLSLRPRCFSSFALHIALATTHEDRDWFAHLLLELGHSIGSNVGPLC